MPESSIYELLSPWKRSEGKCQLPVEAQYAAIQQNELASSAAFPADPEVVLKELHRNASEFNLMGTKQQEFNLYPLTLFPSFSKMDHWGAEPTKSRRAASTKAFFVHFLELKS